MKEIKNFKNVIRTLFLALYIIIPFSPIFSLSWTSLNCDYIKTSEEIYQDFSSNEYESKKISIKKLPVSSSESEKFPNNILIKIDSTTYEALPDTERTNVIFAFNQSEYSENPELFKKFVSFLRYADMPYTSYILFAPDSIFNLNNEDSLNHISGTTSFLKDFYENDFSIAITFTKNNNLKQGKFLKIIPGGSKEISPAWLVKDIMNSATESSYTSDIPSNFVLLYRNNLINEDNEVSTFLENGIPAIGIEYNDYPSLFLLQNLSASLKDNKPFEWEKHYAYFHFYSKPQFINEITLIILYLSFVSICLAILSFMIFLKNEKNEKKVHKLQSTWYFSFFVILITFVFLTVFQKFFSSISESGALCFLGKTIFTLIIVFSILIIQMNFNFKISNRASAYYLIIFASINLILFSVIDISLIFIFFEEFIIAYICKNVTKGWLQHLFSFMLTLPFLPIIYSIIKYTDPQILYELSKASPAGNFLTSLILFPIIVQWSRLVKNQKIFKEDSDHTLKYFIFKSALTIAGTSFILVLTFIGIWHTAKNAYKINLTPIPQEKIIIQESNAPDFTATLKQSGYNEFRIWNLNLESSEKIIRYNVYAQALNSVPVYGSNFNYEFINQNKIFFSIPDYPSEKLTISFRAEPTDEIKITVIAYSIKKNVITKSNTIISLEQ